MIYFSRKNNSKLKAPINLVDMSLEEAKNYAFDSCFFIGLPINFGSVSLLFK